MKTHVHALQTEHQQLFPGPESCSRTVRPGGVEPSTSRAVVEPQLPPLATHADSAGDGHSDSNVHEYSFLHSTHMWKDELMLEEERVCIHSFPICEAVPPA